MDNICILLLSLKSGWRISYLKVSLLSTPTYFHLDEVLLAFTPIGRAVSLSGEEILTVQLRVYYSIKLGTLFHIADVYLCPNRAPSRRFISLRAIGRQTPCSTR